MGDDEPDLDQDPDIVEAEELPPRDHVVDQAKEEFEAFFATNNAEVYYQRQLQVRFEQRFFHWITAHALSELADEGKITAENLPLRGSGNVTRITLYHAPAHRYWRRQANEIVELVSRFSEPAFTAALGAQGETLFDAALPSVGFMPTARKVAKYKGKPWPLTQHDLDRIFERDGIAYGAEIKNTLSYIDRGELKMKLLMCRYFGVRPPYFGKNFMAEPSLFSGH